jgi:hypothetical protein
VAFFGFCKAPAAPASSSSPSSPSPTNGQGATRDNQILSGSVLTLSLPLGDVSLPMLIARFIKQVLSIVGVLTLLLFIWGGLQYMLSRGDAAKVVTAKKIIIAAISGLIVIFTSYAILNFIINAVSKP